MGYEWKQPGKAVWKTLQMQYFDISLKLLLSILILLPKDCLSRSGKVNRVQQLDIIIWIQSSVLTICHVQILHSKRIRIVTVGRSTHQTHPIGIRCCYCSRLSHTGSHSKRISIRIICWCRLLILLLVLLLSNY